MNAAEIKNFKSVLNEVADRIGEWSDSKGFRDDILAADKIEGIAPEIAAALRNNVVLAKLALINSETAEALESFRLTGWDGHLQGEGNFGEELADAVIRIFDLSDLVGINIGDEVISKMAVNEKRSHKHGKKL